MFEDVLQNLEYEGKFLIEDVKLGIAEREDVVRAIDQLKKIKEKADEIIRNLTTYATAIEERELEELERELEEKPEEEFEELEIGEVEAKPLERTIPFREAITIALAQHPKASPELKRKAKEITEKYGLTEEDVQRIVKWYYG